MGLEHPREVLGLVAQDASLCSGVRFTRRRGEAASDPPAPLQSHAGPAGSDKAHPSLAQPFAGLSWHHLSSLSPPAGSAVSGSLESPVKRVGHAVLSSQSCLTLRHHGLYGARQAPLSLGILLARILEWVPFPFSRGSS